MQSTVENRLTLRAIRQHEVAQVATLLPPAATILEIGAGAGWQAEALAQYGHHVDAIDLKGSHYRDAQIWPVTDYDGVHIPFPAQRFDVVFSSNVLEHVESLELLLADMRRVLKPGGIAVHLLPTSSWRSWATVSHYLLWGQRLLGRLTGQARRPKTERGEDGDAESHERSPGHGGTKKLRLVPPPHGAKGNFLTETYWFSRRRWLRFFQRNGWRVTRCVPNQLFYTRVLTLRASTRIDSLVRLSRFFGSSCLIYVLEPELGSPPSE